MYWDELVGNCKVEVALEVKLEMTRDAFPEALDIFRMTLLVWYAAIPVLVVFLLGYSANRHLLVNPMSGSVSEDDGLMNTYESVLF